MFQVGFRRRRTRFFSNMTSVIFLGKRKNFIVCRINRNSSLPINTVLPGGLGIFQRRSIFVLSPNLLILASQIARLWPIPNRSSFAHLQDSMSFRSLGSNSILAHKFRMHLLISKRHSPNPNITGPSLIHAHALVLTSPFLAPNLINYQKKKIRIALDTSTLLLPTLPSTLHPLSLTPHLSPPMRLSLSSHLGFSTFPR